MHAKPDGSEVNVERGFYSKGPWQRLLVLFAGPFFSIAFGMVVLVALFTTVGKAEPDTRPIIGLVTEDSGAGKAGLQVGDEIVAVDGVPISSFYDLTVQVGDNWREVSEGKYEPIPAQVTYRREGAVSTVTVVPMVDDEPMPLRDENMELTKELAVQARLGVLYGDRMVRTSLMAATKEAVEAPVLMVTSLASMVVKPSSAGEQVAGPTTMAKVTSAAVKSGLYYVIWFAAMLSISLGVLNLLPIVPLDGGQMVVAFVEMFRGGRRLSIKMQQVLANTGIGLLVLLFLAASAVDLGRNAKENERSEQAQEK
jgi:regulator of sigma E protease